jgi:hypothetical protein
VVVHTVRLPPAFGRFVALRHLITIALLISAASAPSLATGREYPLPFPSYGAV